MQIKDYVDPQGITRRVALPDDWHGDDPSEGIPVSLDLDDIYGDLPIEFRRKLYTALHEAGLVTPCDYLPPGASDKFRRALLLCIKHEFFDVLALAREVCSK